MEAWCWKDTWLLVTPFALLCVFYSGRFNLRLCTLSLEQGQKYFPESLMSAC